MSIDDAVATAAQTLGRDVEILHARRVRRGGLLGFFANERIEVTARAASAATTGPVPSGRHLTLEELAQLPPPPAMVAPPERQKPGRRRRDSVEEFNDYLGRLVEEVERREGQGGGFDQPRRFTDDDLVPLPADDADPMAAAPVAAAAAAPVAPDAPAIAGPVPAVPATVPPTALPAPPEQTTTIDLRRRHIGGPVWSTENLRRLGLPERIVEAVHVEPDAGDMAWTLAVERALRLALPTAAPSVQAVAMHGYGLEAAVTLINAAMHGYPIGDLHLPDRLAKVTSFELALAVRSLLCR